MEKATGTFSVHRAAERRALRARRLLAQLLIGLAFVAGCNAASTTAEPPVVAQPPVAAESTPTAPIATPEPGPTAVEPTAAPELETPEPENPAAPELENPEPENPAPENPEPEIDERATLTALTLAELTPPPLRSDLVVPVSADDAVTGPVFVEPAPELTALIGSVHGDALEPFQYELPQSTGAGTVINVVADETDSYSVSWRDDGTQVDFGFSKFLFREIEGQHFSILQSVWTMKLEPGQILTFSNNVCFSANPTHDPSEEQFIAIVNQEQDTALGAWRLTTSGPVEFSPLSDLTCERFIP